MPNIRDAIRGIGGFAGRGYRTGVAAGAAHPKTAYGVTGGAAIGAGMAANAEDFTPKADVDQKTGERVVTMPDGQVVTASTSGVSPEQFNQYWEQMSVFERNPDGSVKGSTVDAGLLGTIAGAGLAMSPLGQRGIRAAGRLGRGTSRSLDAVRN